MLKIITERPSDNGNRFLCLECDHANIRSGTGSEMEVYCDADFYRTSPPEAWQRVPFIVTQCSLFARKDAWKDKAIKSMQAQAYYVDASQEGRGITLIPPDEAKRRDLWK